MRWCWLILLTSCATPLSALNVETSLELDGQSFTVRSHDGAPPADAKLISSAIEKATPSLARWGGIPEPVTVYVVKSHRDLEAASHRSGLDWLKAWGWYDKVLFQSPSTWTTDKERVNQLVLHELTHCLLFQRTGTRETFYLKGIPLWFREGMAIHTAGQGRDYATLEDSAKWLEKNPDLNGFRDGEELSQKDFDAVYGLGLHAFRFLLKRHSDEKIRALMSAIQAGAPFDEAFAAVFGQTAEDFQRDFEGYLKRRAFRTEVDAQTR